MAKQKKKRKKIDGGATYSPYHLPLKKFLISFGRFEWGFNKKKFIEDWRVVLVIINENGERPKGLRENELLERKKTQLERN